jgi:hypothetical protein
VGLATYAQAIHPSVVTTAGLVLAALLAAGAIVALVPFPVRSAPVGFQRETRPLASPSTGVFVGAVELEITVTNRSRQQIDGCRVVLEKLECGTDDGWREAAPNEGGYRPGLPLRWLGQDLAAISLAATDGRAAVELVQQMGDIGSCPHFV